MEYEITNNRGPLFSKADKFYKKFVPNINAWEWTQTIPSSVFHIKYDNVKYISQDGNTINTVHVSDDKLHIRQLKHIVNVLKPRMLIVNDIILEPSSSSATMAVTDTNNNEDDGGGGGGLFVGVIKLVVLKNFLDASVVNLIARYFPHLKELYFNGLYGEISQMVYFSHLKTLSIVQTSYANLLKITAHELTDLDVYHVIDLPPVPLPDAASENANIIRTKDVTVITRASGTLQSLRIDSNLLWGLGLMGKLQRFQCFGRVQYADPPSPSPSVVASLFKATDLILPPNVFGVSDLAKCRSSSTMLGIYNNDKHLLDHLLSDGGGGGGERGGHYVSIAKSLKIYNVASPHETILVRNNALYSNINFLHASYYFAWHHVILQILKTRPGLSLHIAREIIMMPDTPTSWPNYILAMRSNTAISTANGTLTIMLSCKPVPTILDFVLSTFASIDMLNDLHADSIRLDAFHLIMVGDCNGRYTNLSAQLKKLKNLSSQNTAILQHNLTVSFQGMQY